MNRKSILAAVFAAALLALLMSFVMAPAAGIAAPKGKGKHSITAKAKNAKATAAKLKAAQKKAAAKAKAAAAAKAKAKAAKAKALKGLKNAAGSQIAVRLLQVKKLEGKVTAATSLDADDRDAFLVDLGEERAALLALKAEIDAAADAAVVKAKSSIIVHRHKVTSIFQPRLEGLLAAATAKAAIAPLEEQNVSLDAQIAAAAADGRLDVTALEALSADFKVQVLLALAAYESADSYFGVMEPSAGFGVSKAAFEQGVAAITAGNNAIAAAQLDLDNIVAGLASLVAPVIDPVIDPVITP